MGKRGPDAKFVVRLSSEERAELEELICKGIGVAYRLLKARILLKVKAKWHFTTEDAQGMHLADGEYADFIELRLAIP